MKRVFSAMAAIGIALGAYVHFRLWHGVYHRAPIHQMFVLNIVLSAFLAIAVFIPRRVFAAAGGLLAAGSLGALALSRTSFGLPTSLHVRWMEKGLAPSGQTLFGVSDTLLVIIAESVALLACVGVVLATTRADRAESAPGDARCRRGAPVPQWAMPL
jgi:hypothetical protein